MGEKIRLVHGNGGRFSQELMKKYIQPYFHNELLDTLHDGAQLQVQAGRLAFSTDSYVVTPPIFPGGNIGKLAVCGTVNDLAMNGAIPKYLSCGLILEEGLDTDLLVTILQAMADMAALAGVQIVTGDTKVVERGAVDQIYINTAGLGEIPEGISISPTRSKPGMKVILSGTVGDHAVAVMESRYGLDLSSRIVTDCAPLNKMVESVLAEVTTSVAVLRDPTRGGLATALTELAEQGQVGILIQEEKIPVREEVRSVCQLLGYDPLYLANEGKAIFIVEPEVEERVLEIIRQSPYGTEAVCIGEIVANNAGKVALQTAIGGRRLLEPLGEDQVPRIC